MVDVLFVTDRRFWRRSIGSEQRIASLIQFVAREGLSVGVAYVGRISGDEGDRVARFEAQCDGLEIVGRKTTLRGLIGNAIRAGRKYLERFPEGSRRSQRGDERSASGSHSEPRRRFVEHAVERMRPRFVVVEFLRLAYTVERIVARREARMGSTVFVIDTIDVLHRRADRYREAGAHVEQAVGEAEEVTALELFDLVLAIQSVEGEVLRQLLPQREILVVPHGIDLPRSEPASESPSIESTSELHAPIVVIGFLGGRDDANVDSISWFAREVWPRLRERFGSDVSLHVAGPVCDTWNDSDEGITRLGKVDRIDDFWRTIDIAINPVRFGSGLKIKNVEALAFGRALVTTSIGAEGLEDASLEALVVADGPESWFSALQTLVSEESTRDELGRSGRRFAEEHLSEEAAFSPFVAALKSRVG